MRAHVRFGVNAPSVIHEEIDGETMVLNLASGTYYGLTGPAATIWALVSRGASLDEVVVEVVDRYRGDPATIEAEVRRFLADLEGQELILPAPEPELGGPRTKGASLPAGGRPAFEPPVLLGYTDMKELLILDPIHDVTDSGWPVKK